MIYIYADVGETDETGMLAMYKRLKNPTYFVAGRELSFSDVGKVITFEKIVESGGSGMNKETGVYKAPKPSRYVLNLRD